MKMKKLNIENGNTIAPKIYQTSGIKPNRRCKKLHRKLQNIMREIKNTLNSKIEGYIIFMNIKAQNVYSLQTELKI